MTEQPLVSLGVIAKHLRLESDRAASRHLKKYKVPTFKSGKCIAVYPSTLKQCQESVECT